jgi:hypothetical protein
VQGLAHGQVSQGASLNAGSNHGDLTERHTEAPTSTKHWQVRTLDLVSLLLHDEPVVYISNHLPRLRTVQENSSLTTRPLSTSLIGRPSGVW